MSEANTFVETVHRYRAQYAELRDRSNLFGMSDRSIATIGVLTERARGRQIETFWLENGDSIQCVRLVDAPGTLSGDILRLHRNLPTITGHFEIDGNTINHLDSAPPVREYDDDTEDMTPALACLPVVEVDLSKHHIKKGKYQSEVYNLLKCHEGGRPGEPISPHIIRLYGRSANDELVFERLFPRYMVLGRFCSIRVYKRWIQHLVTGLKALHSRGIVHRDLHIENLLFSDDGERLVIADLECRWGQRSAPEIACDDGTDSGWTEKSDIYDVGVCIQCMIYANIPASGQTEWPIPAPFDVLVEACQRTNPEERPSPDDLLAILDRISDDSCD